MTAPTVAVKARKKVVLGPVALVAAGLGVVSSLAPSVAVARLSVVQGLKTLD